MSFDFSDDEADSLLKTLDQAEDTPIMIVNDQDEVILFNHDCEKLLGFDSEDVVGTQINELLAEEDKGKATNTFLPRDGSRPGSVRAAFKSKKGGVRTSTGISSIPMEKKVVRDLLSVLPTPRIVGNWRNRPPHTKRWRKSTKPSSSMLTTR